MQEEHQRTSEGRADERAHWNQRYAARSHAGAEPDPFLLSAWEQYVLPLHGSGPGTALDVAGGLGRHAIWLARHGWRATLVDVSEVGLAEVERRARAEGVEIEMRRADLRHASLPVEAFDLVLVFFYLERPLLPALAAALRPGGLLVYKTYTEDQPKLSGGRSPSHPMHLLGPNELLHAFEGLRVLHYRETVVEKGVAELVARRS